jgi:hypothetical protein
VKRVIRTSARRGDRELADLIRGLFALEMLSPSSLLYLVSAWVTNIEIFDNRDASFNGLDHDLASRRILLAEVLLALALKGTMVRVVTNDDVHNVSFLHELRQLSRARGCADRITIRTLSDLHVKGLVTDSFHLSGSMNFTFNGINVNGEEVVLYTASDDVQRAQIDYEQRYLDAGVPK